MKIPTFVSTFLIQLLVTFHTFNEESMSYEEDVGPGIMSHWAADVKIT